MKVNRTAPLSDKAVMRLGSSTSPPQEREWSGLDLRIAAFRLLVIAVVAALGLLASAASRAAQTPAGADEEEIAPDLNALKARAEAGQARAQTQLADVLAGSGDFTNAVVWYRKAAEQGEVAAQLTLATLLVTGQGAAKDPQEAAKWLRAAADRIEGVKPAGPVARPAATNAPAYPTNAIVITRSNIAPATNMVATVAPPATNVSRVRRADVLHVVEPVLQDVRPAVRPPTELR